MTEKQIKTLILYASNYSLPKIALKQGVCLTTIRERLKALKKNHKREFDNALGIRGVYKRTRDSIRNTILFSNFSAHNDDTDGTHLENIGNITKRKF